MHKYYILRIHSIYIMNTFYIYYEYILLYKELLGRYLSIIKSERYSILKKR